MHRQDLLDKLAAYRPRDDADAACRDRIETFVRAHPDCFERSLSVGHITGAVWLLNREGTHVLLTHHRKLGLWLQLGGHADGRSDVLAVALSEAREESGITDIVPISESIFDLDVHPIPAHGRDPAHYHYDIRFLCRVTGDDTYQVSDESIDLAWVSKEDFPTLDTDESVLRMYEKWTGREPARTPD
jgi:8-oxo-dGTP pyrophosphatase MutT (NUDIX family)